MIHDTLPYVMRILQSFLGYSSDSINRSKLFRLLTSESRHSTGGLGIRDHLVTT